VNFSNERKEADAMPEFGLADNTYLKPAATR
jgi:hypothetical protein